MIYLDNAATTKVRDEVVEAMLPFFTENYGNPSSKHSIGEKARDAMEKSREVIAKKIKARPEEMVFTSGATESNNLALKGVDKKIFVSSIEHPSVYEPASGAKMIKVDSDGIMDLNSINKIPKNSFLSVVLGNNEIGTLQDTKQISEVARERNILFHSDAAQCLGKVKIKSDYFDMLTFSSHKIHGPKGAGALYIKEGIKIKPLIRGGGQEKSLRAGTENIAGIVGFAKAVELMNDDYCEKASFLRDRVIRKILEIDNSILTGHKTKRLCSIASFAFKNVEGEQLVRLLDSHGVCASTGSACKEGEIKESHVLRAINLPKEYMRGSLRLSPSIFNTKEEIDEAAETVKKAVESFRIVKR